MLSDQPMQLRDPRQPFRQPPARQPPPVLIHDLDVVVVFGPVIADKQHDASSLITRRTGSAEEAPSDLMVKCLPASRGHDIPSAVTPPYDQRAHRLPPALQGQRA